MRAPGTDPALPTAGTGEYDWRGFLPFAGHAQAINPPSGLLLNWNNKPAADVGSADSNFAYGSVHRVELLRPALAARRKHTLAGVTGAMNAAATQDLHATDAWPAIRAVLRTGTAPSARAEAAVGLVDSWWGARASRLDRELDGTIDDPGAAVMDAAWPRLADAVMSPVLGPLVDRLARLTARSDDPAPNGSSFISG
ncbi:MAG: penicillin acylase family protein [Actinomycetota bacterium]|nr:penicillin acylase family protein [Actinomycetota bacterium]